LVLSIIAYILSSTKLEIRAESVCMVARGKGDKEESRGDKGRGGGKGAEMIQTLCANMNKIKKILISK
jgi:hypothetical protein